MGWKVSSNTLLFEAYQLQIVRNSFASGPHQLLGVIDDLTNFMEDIERLSGFWVSRIPGNNDAEVVGANGLINPPGAIRKGLDTSKFLSTLRTPLQYNLIPERG